MAFAALTLVGVLLLDLGLTTEQHRLTAILAATIVLWVTEAIPIPLTGLVALVLLTVFDVPGAGTTSSAARGVFSEFSSPIVFLLIGSFIMTQAVVKHGLGERIALRVLSLPGVGGSSYRVVIVVGLLGALGSAVVDNGAVVSILLPISLGLIHTLSAEVEKSGVEPQTSPFRLTIALLLMTAYAPTLGGLLTPIGDGSNLLGLSFLEAELGRQITFLEWGSVSLVVVIPLFLALSASIFLLNRPEVSQLNGLQTELQRRRDELAPMSSAERNTALAFGVALTLWLTPSALALILGPDNDVYLAAASRLHPAVGALVGAAVLFVLPIEGTDDFTLSWRDTQELDWGPVFLIGSAVALGAMIAGTDLAHVTGQAIAGIISGFDAVFVYLGLAGVAIATSEMTSNLVSVSVLVPTIPALTAESQASSQISVLIATFAATYGFMLPISTSANAIVFSSGKLPLRAMLKTGLLVDISGAIIVSMGVWASSSLTGVVS